MEGRSKRPRVQKLDDLPAVVEGDYGLVVHIPLTGPSYVAEYDDDDHDDDGPGAIIYSTHGIDTVPFDSLRRCPPGYQGLSHHHGGVVYVIAPNPDLSLCRIKVGHSRNFAARLRQFCAVAPQALVLGLYPGDRSSESLAHSVLHGRVGDSEVFDVLDPFESCETIRLALGV